MAVSPARKARFRNLILRFSNRRRSGIVPVFEAESAIALSCFCVSISVPPGIIWDSASLRIAMGVNPISGFWVCQISAKMICG